MNFIEYIAEKAAGGSEAGKLEIVKTPVAKAKAWGIQAFKAYGRDLEKEVPNHDENYELAQKKARGGHTKRKDMPVIAPNDVKSLQKMLSKGTIDIHGPFAPSTDKSNPFPEGLSGKRAEEFFQRGLKIYDGSQSDDKVKITKGKVPVKKLSPIQQQIYYDNSMDKVAKFGVKASADFHKTTTFIVSSDLRIIDGHHRFLSALLINPNVMVNIMIIDLPISELLPLTKAFGDARGNKRNA